VEGRAADDATAIDGRSNLAVFFEDTNAPPGSSQLTGGSQAGWAGPHNQNIKIHCVLEFNLWTKKNRMKEIE
jgi:hypothetical protein